MTIIQAILLGIIQGISEFLPISSTAHLTLAGKYLGLIDPNNPEHWTAYIAIIQLGTLAAVIIYFFEDVISMLRDLVKDARNKPSGDVSRWGKNSRLAGQIFVGTLPVATIGLALKKIIEGNLTKELTTIGSSMILLALVLIWAEKAGKRNRSIGQTTWKDGLLVGIGQCFALIPGSSRSGTTISTALFLGFDRETAARYSFLLSIPAVFASGMLELYEARHYYHDLGTLNIIVGTLVSGIVGYLSIAFLLKYLKTHSTYLFIWYRLALGIFLWVLIFMGHN
ncbi:MAG: undecaprenyl-diphosphatase UppP [Bacteroidota bacterium]